MRRTLGLITALRLAAPAVIWTQGNPDRPFRFQGRTWVNQEAFIASGSRCATRDLTPERRDQVDREIAAHLNQRGGAAAVTGGVYFHVLTNAAGDGDLRDNQISRQITVLNNAFGPWGWTFNTRRSTAPQTTPGSRWSLARRRSVMRKQRSDRGPRTT